MTKRHTMPKIFIMLVALVLAAAAAGSASAQSEQIGPFPGNGSDQCQYLVPTGDLTTDEEAALSYMREEEKLARDVYLLLYDVWGLPIFSNIARSEQSHMDAVGNLLAAYDLPDPAAGNGPGEFSNTALQELYDTLAAEGRQSQEDALLVGAAIEEIDILDLQSRLEQTENAAVRQVFENLLAGSSNHLRAFVTNLDRWSGTPYSPQYMEQAAFDAIINASSGWGNGAGGYGMGFNSGGPGWGQGNGRGRSS